MEAGLLTGRLRDGKWSVLEIIEHLVLAEEDVLIDAANLDTLPARRRRAKHRVGYLVVMFVLRFDIPVAAPSDAMLPTGSTSLPELRSKWEANHRRLGELVDGLDRAAADRAIFRHPVAGPMTVPQATRMLEVHLDRHIRQIGKLERLYRERPS
jgi:hypothetical protein